MTSNSPQDPGPASRPEPPYAPTPQVGLEVLWRAVAQGRRQIVGLGILGACCGFFGAIITGPFRPATLAIPVALSFLGYEHGCYPNGAKFSPDDLIDSQIVGEALKRLSLAGTWSLQSAIQDGLAVEGTYFPKKVIRADAEPDGLLLTLSLRRNFPLTDNQRRALVKEIIAVYREQLKKNYGKPPVGFGDLPQTLQRIEYFDFEQAIDLEMDQIRDFLDEKTSAADDFPLRSTRPDYADLRRQFRSFAQFQPGQSLGLIDSTGVVRDLANAPATLQYRLRKLDAETREALAREQALLKLLAGIRDKMPISELVAKADPPGQLRLIDQRMIDHLVSNDAYGYLVRRAAEEALRATKAGMERERLQSWQQKIDAFSRLQPAAREALLARVQNSIASWNSAYRNLIALINQAQADSEQEELAGAVRISGSLSQEGKYAGMAPIVAIGLGLGLAIGGGLSLLGIYLGGPKHLSFDPSFRSS